MERRVAGEGLYEVPGAVGTGLAAGSVVQRSSRGTQFVRQHRSSDLGLKVGQIVLPDRHYFTSGVQGSNVADVGGVDAFQIFKVIIGVKGTGDAAGSVEERSSRGAGHRRVGRGTDGVGEVYEVETAQIDVSVGGRQSNGVGRQLRNVASVVVEVVPLAAVAGHTVSSVEEGSGRGTVDDRPTISRSYLLALQDTHSSIHILDDFHACQGRVVAYLYSLNAGHVLQIHILERSVAGHACTVGEGEGCGRGTGVGLVEGGEVLKVESSVEIGVGAVAVVVGDGAQICNVDGHLAETGLVR